MITGLTREQIYAIQYTYEVTEASPTGETITTRMYAGRDAYVWPSNRAAGLGEDYSGERVATYPLNDPRLDRTYSYVVCGDTFPELWQPDLEEPLTLAIPLTTWKQFIKHAFGQWEIATNGLVSMKRLDNVQCADYSEFLADIRERIAAAFNTLIYGQPPPDALVQIYVTRLLDSFDQANIEPTRNSDYLINEVMVVNNRDPNDAINIAGRFNEVATKVGHGTCISPNPKDTPLGCALKKVVMDEDDNRVITRDIRLMESEFGANPVRFPGSDRVASKTTCYSTHVMGLRWSTAPWCMRWATCWGLAGGAMTGTKMTRTARTRMPAILPWEASRCIARRAGVARPIPWT